jgi:hypothetical protein
MLQGTVITVVNYSRNMFIVKPTGSIIKMQL